MPVDILDSGSFTPSGISFGPEAIAVVSSGSPGVYVMVIDLSNLATGDEFQFSIGYSFSGPREDVGLFNGAQDYSQVTLPPQVAAGTEGVYYFGEQTLDGGAGVLAIPWVLKRIYES